MRNLTLTHGRARRALLPLLLVLLLALAACGADGMDAGDDDSLTAGDWALQSITTPEGVVTTIPDPDLYTVQFNTDGTLTGLADCNNFGGEYTADGGDLTIITGATTLAACGPDSLDALYLDTLLRVVSSELDDDVLILTTAEGEALRFARSGDVVGVADDLDPTAAGFLGLPWWAWLLLVLLIIGLLWWLLSRGGDTAPAPPVAHTDLPESRTTAWQEATEADLAEDDLTRIEGIGPKTQTLLKSEGIRTYAALANASVADLQQILESSELSWALGDPTTWPQQARLAAAGQWAELEALQARLDHGRQV